MVPASQKEYPYIATNTYAIFDMDVRNFSAHLQQHCTIQARELMQFTLDLKIRAWMIAINVRKKSTNMMMSDPNASVPK